MKIELHTRFKRDYKLAVKRDYDMSQFESVIRILASGAKLPERYKDHPLQGQYKGCRECHIMPDWLLIYEVNNNDGTLYLTRTGTHADLFGI